MTPAVRAEVDAVYRAADAAVAAAGPKCEASGRCCRFAEYGHTLFLSRFEADVLLATAPAYAAPVSRAGCPFQVGGLCTARDERPVGCRVYFCDESYTETGNAITEAAVAALKAVADRHGTGWQYAPLHVFLNGAPPRPDAPPASSRVSLSVVPTDPT